MTIREEFKVHGLAMVKSKKNSGRKYRFKVSTVKPNPKVWNLALKLANGDTKRIFVKSSTECVVVNNECQKQALVTRFSNSQQSHS